MDALRSLSVSELTEKLAENRLALARAKFDHAVTKLERTSNLKDLRKNIARILTLLQQKKGEA
ncbi:MAG: 50S ribosomal protein L29 [Desulfovibrionaceae bacterium]|nr:50S ribosomal protein L29 [Desulfovibrionaceae bacterium]